MMNPYKITNPVERRILKVNEDWRYVTGNTQAKLIYWQLPEADFPLLETFFQIQSENANGVQYYQGEFKSSQQYCQVLIDQLYYFYDSRREGSRQKGIKAEWQLPEKEDKEQALNYFFRILEDLSAYHPDLFPFFTFVLVPYKVKSYHHFANWFDDVFALMESHPWIKKHIIFVSYSEEADWLTDLIDNNTDKVCLLTKNYQSQNIAKEMLAESSDRGAGADLRRIFVELMPILKENNPQKLEQLMSRALAICQQQKWFDQSLVFYLLGGAAYLSWKDKEKSLLCYQNGVQVAKQAHENQHPAGGKLVANALFGEASVYLVEKKYEKAAQCYLQIPAYTFEAEDYILTVEAWRMVIFCYKKSRNKEKAIDAGFNALDAGLFLDNEMRVNSSLPEAAQLLVALVPHDHDDFDRLDEKLIDLFGDSWRELLQARQDANKMPA